MSNDINKSIINIIHILFVIFVLYTPFSGIKKWLEFHYILVPFLFLHWVTNNNTCFLTNIECIITGEKDTKKTFVGKIVEPIYEIQIWQIQAVTLLLWLITKHNLSSFKR